MTKHARKEILNKEQQLSINRLHNIQIAIEIILVILTLTFFTINIASIWPDFANTNSVIMVLSLTALFICGSGFTADSANLKQLGEPLISSGAGLRKLLLMTWCWIPVFLAVIIFANTFAINAPLLAKSISAGIVIVCFFITIIAVLISAHILWKRYNNAKRFPIRPVLYSILVIIMTLVSTLITYTTTESIKHNISTQSDINLEIGQTEVRQAGKDGQKQIKHNLIFGFVTSTSQTDAVDQITAKGTRRYQYMYCSNGSYRYYTADQFRIPTVGFTHQSEDFCAKNGEGTQTTLADVPPAQTVIQQNITRRSPTSFSCYSIYSGSVNCYGY